MKKMLSIILVAILVMGCVPALADCNPCTTETWKDTGCPKMIISSEGRIVGIKAPNIVEESMGFQNWDKTVIGGFLENGLVRRKGVARVAAYSSGELYAGFTNIPVTVEVTNVAAVEVILGISREYLTAEAVVEGTMYVLPCGLFAGHRFFVSSASKFVVAKVYFNCGRNYAYIFAGDWDGDGELELGFQTGYQVYEQTCTPCPRCHCWPCFCGYIHVDVDVHVDIHYSYSYGYSYGGCYGGSYGGCYGGNYGSCYGGYSYCR